MDRLITPDGKSIECYCTGGNHWFSAEVWTREEAEEYVKTGVYPKRLLEIIKEKHGQG